MPLGNPIRKQNESRMVSVLATEGQTVFTVQGGYIINHISVFRNGVRLSPAEDFTAGDGSTVTLNNAANIDDRIDFHIFDRFTVQNAIVGAASTQTISGDLVLTGKLFGELDVPSINTGIATVTELDVNGKGDISGDLNVTGVSTFTGVVTTGGALIVGAGVTIGGAIVPSTDGNINLGSSSKEWQHLFIDGVAFIDNLAADTAAIADLTDNRVVIAGSSGELEDSANLTFDGSTLTVTGDVSIADKIIHTGDTNTAIRFPAADTITAETGGSERLRIDSSGNLGINNTNPIVPLDVTTTSNEIAHFTGANDGELKFRNATSNIFLAYTNTSDIFQLGTNGQNVRVHVAVNGNVGLNETNPGHKLTVGGDGYFGFTSPTDAARQIIFNANRGSAADTLANINWQWNSKNVAQIRGIAGADTSNKDDGHLAFFTSAANSLVERLRIDSSGRLLLGTTTEGSAGADEFTINTASGHGGMTIRNDTSSNGNIWFSDGTSGAAEYAGYVQYAHDGDHMVFGTGGSERMRITSAGKVGINETSPDQALHVKGTGGDTVPMRVQSTGATSRIGFEVAGSSNSYNVSCGAAGANIFAAYTNNTERFRITASGTAMFGGDTGTPIVDNGEIFYRGNSTKTFENLPQSFYLYSDDIAYNGTNPGTGMLFGGAYNSSAQYTTLSGIHGIKQNSNDGNVSGVLVFGTRQEGASTWERMRIDSSGYVGFGKGSTYAPETPIDVFFNWANARSNIATSNTYDRKLPLDERGDITLTTRHSPTKDGAVGYVGPIIDFRSTNTSSEEWTVAQLVGGTDPLGGNNYQGGLSIFTSNGGTNNPSGRRDQGDAPTLSAVFAPFRLTTFTTTSAQGNMAIHVTKNHAANNVQSDMIAFDVGGAGRGKIVSAPNGTDAPQLSGYSDRRLKTNFRDYTGGYDRIKSIPVKLYDEVLNDQTKSVFGDNVKTDVIGWIADEVQSVFPEAVVGTKDQVATADDVTAGISTAIGDPIYQSLTAGTFLPDAIQAIQKLIEKVETLETKVAALEGS